MCFGFLCPASSIQIACVTWDAFAAKAAAVPLVDGPVVYLARGLLCTAVAKKNTTWAECVVSGSVVCEYSPPEQTRQALQVNGARLL